MYARVDASTGSDESKRTTVVVERGQTGLDGTNKTLDTKNKLRASCHIHEVELAANRRPAMAKQECCIPCLQP